MFQRNPFAAKPASSPRKHVSPSQATGPISKDEPSPPTPIVTSIQTPWNDPPSSWTSSTAAYDENPRYTTANNSYTHRRKGSLITGLLARQNDPYQPTYQDWRQMTPESPRGRFSLNSGIPKEHEKDSRSRKKSKIFAGVLIVVVLAMSGVWIFDGPLPLLKLDGFQNRFGGAFAGDIWPASISKPILDWKKYKLDIGINWDIQRLIPQHLSRGLNLEAKSELDNFATASSTSTKTSTVYLNSDLLPFPLETVSKVTRRSSPTPSFPPVDRDVIESDMDKRTVVPPVVKPIHNAEASVTTIGPPVQARSEPEQVESSIEKSTGAEKVATGHPSHVEEMFRKHARVVTPIAIRTHDEEASPPGSMVPVNTAVEGEESGSN